MPPQVRLPSYGYLGAAQSYASRGARPFRYTGGNRPDRRFSYKSGNFIMISDKTLDELADWMKRMDGSIHAFRFGQNAITQIMAQVHHSECLQRSRGVWDPYRQRRQYAWKVPVRRISEDYYRGWKLKRWRPSMWEVFNESREAYFIEFGIHKGANRIRRPVNKLSLIWTLRWAESTRIYERIWGNMFATAASKRIGMTGGTAGNSFAGAQVQSPATMMAMKAPGPSGYQR